jgi:Domain of Unknown Function (DUF748)
MKMTFWRSMKARERKISLWVLGILIFYTIIGFLVLPPIIRAVAVRELSENLDRKVSIQKVKVNPFVPSVTIRGLLILDKDNQPFLSWNEVYVNLEISSIFRQAWTFREISVTGPFVRAEMNKNYTFNFSDILKKYSATSTNAAQKKASKPLLVRVKRLNVTDARMSIADYTVRTPFRRIVGPVYLTASNVCTVPDSGGSGTIFGKTDAGDYFSWRGNFCITPPRSAGNVAVFDVIVNKFKPLYQDIMSFDIRSGQSAFCANYRFEWDSSNHIAEVTNAAFGLYNFRLGQEGHTNDIIDLGHFAETSVSGALQSHHGEIGLMKFSDAAIYLERGKNMAFNLIQVSKPKVSKPSAPGGILFFLNTITNAVATLINSTNKWTGIIHEIDFTNCGGHLLDLAYARPATLDLNRINVNAKNISNYPDTNITAGVSMDWNKNGTINVGVTARISPPTVDVRVGLDKLDLSTLAPYGESQFNLLIPSADLGMKGDVHMSTPEHKLPVVTFRGDTWLDNFHAVDGKGADLLKWDEIRVSGIDANLNPPSASIERISVNNVSANVIIETNRTINLLASLHPPGTNTVGQTNAPAVAKTSSTSATNAIPPVSIVMIAITNAQIAFTDRSLTPNVNMVIENAGGTITGITSKELQHGHVNLRALVDGVGPARITGRINPFSGTLTNQMTIFMTNMDMLPTSPYAGKFAGYRIARGTLSVSLQYTVVGRKLQSENVITLNQFTFGDKVDSPDATKLPVRLAIAILKDRRGRIVLDVPIQGSLDDPKFRIGKVVERALLNILSKVATAPFSLIGAAFGGGGGSGEELSHEDFDPGSTDLNDATKKKLDILVKALYDRPGIQVEISGSVDPVYDRRALQQIAFENQLRTLEWKSLRRSQRQITPPDAVVVTPKDRARLVTKLYDEALDKGTLSPGIIAANTNLAAIASQIKSAQTTTVKQAQYLTKSTGPASEQQTPPPPSTSASKVPLPTDPREALLEAIIPVTESDLKTLAMNRARAVRSYILNSGNVDPSRLFLAKSPGGTLRQDGSRVYLVLE